MDHTREQDSASAAARSTFVAVLLDWGIGFGIPLGLTLLSAALFTLSFPPGQMRLLAWLALTPLLMGLRRVGPMRAALLGLVWSLAMSYGVTDWLVTAVAGFYQQPAALGVALLLVTTLLGASIEYIAFAVFYNTVSRAGMRTTPLLAAAAWAGCELLRTRIGAGNPWGLLGYSQTGLVGTSAISVGDRAALYVSQIADLGGVYAVSFVLAMVSALAAELVPAVRSAGERHRLRASAIGVATLVVAALGYGNARIHEPSTAPSQVAAQDLRMEPGMRRVAIVQGNIATERQWREEDHRPNLDVYLTLTEETARDHFPDLIVWPENAMTFFVEQAPYYRSLIAAALRPSGAELVAGSPSYRYDARVRYYNSVFLIDATGSITGRYDKRLLLPFAEYFPLGSIGLLRRRFGQIREFSFGMAGLPLDTAVGRAGVLVCNEAMYPEAARTAVLADAEFLVNVSNDSWVGDTEFSLHAYAMAAMRAVETRRYLVRASTAGPSAVVDPSGRAIVWSIPFTRTTLSAAIAPSKRTTLYTRFGDAFAWACLLLTAGTAWRARSTLRTRRRRNRRSPSGNAHSRRNATQTAPAPQ